MGKKEKRVKAKQRRAEEQQRQEEHRQRAQRRAKRNRVTLLAAGVVAVALLVSAVVQWQLGQDEGPAPAGVTSGGVAIPVGEASAPVTLTVYEDFRCPACGNFEKRFGSTIEELVDAGKLRVEYHIATIIDAPLRGSGSKVAGNAAACAQDAGKFRAYHAELFAHQPPEDDDGFTEERVQELAKNVAGLAGPKFRSCVEEERYRPWLERVQSSFDERFDRAPTPTVLLDDKVVLNGDDEAYADAVKTPAKLRKAVDRKAAARS